MSSKWCHANDTLRLQRRIRWSLFFSTMMVRRTNGLFHYDRKGWTKSMWKLFNLLALCMMVLWISACNGTDSPNNDQANDQNKQTHQQENKISTEPLKVEIEMPDQLPVKQEIVLKARLTQGNEPVNDAQEVEFEVWKANQKKQSEMINGSLEKDGVYTAKKTFQEDGVYYVQAHATARGMHVMPVKKLIIGKGGEESEQESSSHDQQQDSEHHHHH